jgi:hypothetical protein
MVTETKATHTAGPWAVGWGMAQGGEGHRIYEASTVGKAMHKATGEAV